MRVFKNARTHLVDRRVITKDLAPSDFLECLIYNVTNENFGNSYRETFCNIVNWVAKTDLEDLLCQNEQLPLFGNTPEQWSAKGGRGLIQELIKLWNNW